MFFGDALSTIRKDIENSSMRLPKWIEGIRIKIETSEEFTNPYLVVVSPFGKIPWIPNMYELMCSKWEVESPLLKDDKEVDIKDDKEVDN